MGTSSGAYAGSLYCAGYSPDEIAKELCTVPPIRLVRLSLIFWRGFLLLDGVVDRLREILPPTFESLQKPLAIGVVNMKGEHQLLTSGPLPEAVAASGAIPILFAPVDVPGNASSPFIDGGVKDRTGLNLWRVKKSENTGMSLEKPTPALVHLIARSSRFSGTEDARKPEAKRVFLLKSNKSKRNFFSLGDYRQEMLDTYDALIPSVERVQQRLRESIKV